jgi:hypothetical protein
MNTFHPRVRINDQGDLLIHLGPEEAGRQVNVLVEPISPNRDPEPLMLGEYRKRIEKLAGAWRGDLEEPGELPYEIRNELE